MSIVIITPNLFQRPDRSLNNLVLFIGKVSNLNFGYKFRILLRLCKYPSLVFESIFAYLLEKSIMNIFLRYYINMSGLLVIHRERDTLAHYLSMPSRISDLKNLTD